MWQRAVRRWEDASSGRDARCVNRRRWRRVIGHEKCEGKLGVWVENGFFVPLTKGYGEDKRDVHSNTGRISRSNLKSE
jgi:hypothetical protein